MVLAQRLRSAILALPPLLLLCSSACSKPYAGGTAAGETPAPAVPKPVRIARPEQVGLDDSFPSSLYVERDVRLTARRSGVIEQVLVERGDRVTAGQPLALLESDVATHEMEIAEEELRLAQAEFDRIRPLHEQKIVSAQDFTRAEATLEGAKTRADLARSLLERCTVRSPFDGIVVERWAVAGQRVREEDAIPLFRVVARESLRARVDVPEDRLPSIVQGSRAFVEVAGDGVARPARVLFVSPAIDPASGTAPVIVETVGFPSSLRLGASVRVRFKKTSGVPPALLVPREALSAGSPWTDGQATLLVADGSRAAARKVRVVEVRGASLVVRGELTAGDRVIVGAAPGLAAGDLVQTREESP